MRGRDKDNPTGVRTRSNGNFVKMLEVGANDTSNTVTSVAKDNLLVEAAVLAQVRTEEGKAVRREHKGDVGVPYGIKGYEPRADGLSNTVTSVAKDNLLAEGVVTAESGCGDRGVVRMRGRWWWVRRLTERELFRLMDLEEGDIDLLLRSGISNTQLAKMAGNSIVVSCLYWIFYKLLVDVGNPSGQRTIFDI
jgi:site-specific DNA-cytosine methylase